MLRYAIRNVKEILPDEAAFQSGLLCVNEERRQEILAIGSECKRIESLAATLLLREILEGYDCSVRFFNLRKDELGKPFLPDYPGTYVSLAHSGDFVAAALAGVPVGIDLQEHRPAKTIDRMARKLFTEKEHALFEAVESKEGRDRFFYDTFAKKEAYVKALGVGMRKDFREIETGAEELGTWHPVEGVPGYSAALITLSACDISR